MENGFESPVDVNMAVVIFTDYPTMADSTVTCVFCLLKNWPQSKNIVGHYNRLHFVCTIFNRLPNSVMEQICCI